VVKEDRMMADLVADSVAEALEAKADVIIKKTSEVEDNLEIKTTIEVVVTTGRNLNTTEITSTKEVINQAMAEVWLTMEANADVVVVVVSNHLVEVVETASVRVAPAVLDMRMEADLNVTIVLELMAC
jgi:sensor histidine kinase regulating citrate/malate metabolism